MEYTKRTRRDWRLAAVALGVVVLAAGCVRTLGGTYGGANDVNDAGTIVGGAEVSGGTLHAFVKTAGGPLVDLGTGSHAGSSATAINASGVVVGSTAIYASGPAWLTPFVWRSSTGLVELPFPAGEQTAWAVDINDSGTIVVDAGRWNDHVYLYDEATGTYTPLPDLGRGFAVATAISPDGTVVGWASPASGGHHAVVWDATTHAITDLDAGLTTASTATGINSSNVIVGWNDDSTAPSIYLWSGGTRTTIGAGRAYDINDANVIVGWSPVTTASGPAQQAQLWDTAHGISLPLGTLSGGDWSEATAINNKGLPVGSSTDGSNLDQPVEFDRYQAS